MTPSPDPSPNPEAAPASRQLPRRAGASPERIGLNPIAWFKLRRPGTPVWKLVVYELCRNAATLGATVFMGYRAHNARRVPQHGAVLLVANHQSFVDPPLIGGCIRPRHFDFLARATLFKNPVFGRLIGWLNSVPIDQSGGDAAAMKEIIRRLREGRAVLVFPEGSRTPDGSVHGFKRGISVLLKRADCPVVPCAIEGAYDAWPRSSKAPRPWTCPVETNYGHPIAHDELMKDGPDAALARLRAEVEALRGELHDSIRRRTKGRYPTSPAPTIAPAPPDPA